MYWKDKSKEKRSREWPILKIVTSINQENRFVKVCLTMMLRWREIMIKLIVLDYFWRWQKVRQAKATYQRGVCVTVWQDLSKLPWDYLQFGKISILRLQKSFWGHCAKSFGEMDFTLILGNVTRFGKISPLCHTDKKLWPFWKSSFSIWPNCELNLENFMCHWAKINRCKWSKTKKIV